jgi:hypothetical protein
MTHFSYGMLKQPIPCLHVLSEILGSLVNPISPMTNTPFFFLYVIFETAFRSHCKGQAGHKLMIICFSLLSAGIIEMCHHA